MKNCVFLKVRKLKTSNLKDSLCVSNDQNICLNSIPHTSVCKMNPFKKRYPSMLPNDFN